MKILILAYETPPNITVGSFRPYAWYKYLGSENLHVTLITRKWRKNANANNYGLSDPEGIETIIGEKNTLIRVPYTKPILRDKIHAKENKSNLQLLFQKFLTLLQTLTIWFLPLLDDKRFLYDAAWKILSKEKFDLIIATGEPYILFKYAYDLSLEFNIPYALDYRDAWFSNERNKVEKNIILKLLNSYRKIFEKKYLKYSDFFITVSSQLKEDIEKDFPFSRGFIIKNGVDCEKLRAVKPKKSNDKFTITYAGHLYKQHNLDAFLKSIEKFITEISDNILVKFIGITFRACPHIKLINSFLNKYPQNIKILDPIPQEEVFSYLKASSCLLKFTWQKNSSNAQSGKMYEYLCLKKPILHILSCNANENQLLKNYEVQYYANNEAEIYNQLNKLYNLWLVNHDLTIDIDNNDINQFCVEENTKKLNQLIKKNYPF